MLRPPPHWRTAAAALTIAALSTVFVVGARLAVGPLELRAAKPFAERVLASRVRGGRATVDRAQLMWFSRSNSVGLRFSGVLLRDGEGRQVLRAGELDGGISLRSLAYLSPAVGQASASDFFMAVSASPEGRYQLGYDAKGKPRVGGGVDRLIGDLTGSPTSRRPLSFLRRVSFRDGLIDFRHIGGRAAWRGRIRQLEFNKSAEIFDAAADIRAATAAGPATLGATARGAVGLDRAFLRAEINNVVPALVAPSAGSAAVMARLDAPLRGRAYLDYGVRTGMRTADIDITAGSGRILIARQFETLREARARVAFDPKSRRMVLKSFRVAAERVDFDLSGWAVLTPQSVKTGPAHLIWSIGAPTGAMALASDRPAETFTRFSARGTFRPDQATLFVDHVRAEIGEAVVAARGKLKRPRPGRSWAVDLDGIAEGRLSFNPILAFWPQRLGPKVRRYLVESGARGSISGGRFAIHLKEGAVRHQRPLPNESIRVDFSFLGAALRPGRNLPEIVDGVGAAVLQGDRFDLAMSRARLEGISLSKGAVTIPTLRGVNKTVRINVRGQGPAEHVLRVVDGPAPHVVSKNGFPPARLGGQADVVVDIVRPLGLERPATLADFTVSYEGDIRGATVQRAALGLDLAAPVLKVRGTTGQLVVTGPSRIGPYRGGLTFTADFAPGKAKTTDAALNGLIDPAAFGLGGARRSTLAFNGRFRTKAGVGEGDIRGDGLNGKVTWTAGPGGRAMIDGRLNTVSLRNIGVPLAASMPATAPVKLVLARKGAGWAGLLTADPYSGAVSFSGAPPGGAPHFRYVAEITPAEAVRLGLGGDPAFARAQTARIDLTTRNGAGRAAYAVGPYDGALDWNRNKDGRVSYHWKAVLTEATLRAMGYPAALRPNGPVPVDVTMSGVRGGWTGVAVIAGSPLNITAQGLGGARRRVSVSGPVSAALLTRLGAPVAGLSGGGDLNAVLEISGKSLQSGRLNIDLTRAALQAPGGLWAKAAGRPLRLSTDIVARPDGGYDLGRITGQGQGIEIDAQAGWRPDGGVLFNARRLKLDTTFDGALQYSRDNRGRRLGVQARSFDSRGLVRRMTQGRGGQVAPVGAGIDEAIRLDLDLGEVRLTDQISLRKARIDGTWGAIAQRKINISAEANGGGAMSLSLFPQGQVTAISGKIDNVSDTAATFFDIVAFKGGKATMTGVLSPGGADLDIQMRNVTLIQAPLLARILTMGSLKGMADTLNGQGIAFQEVVAPIRIRGSTVTLGHSRATGSAIGVTTQGVIDLDRRTVDLSGAVAPAYSINGLIGNVPVLGDLLVSRKGEGVFGMTYTAKGPANAPRVMVNPLSLATPGILRRIFEGRSAADKAPDKTDGPAS